MSTLFNKALQNYLSSNSAAQKNNPDFAAFNALAQSYNVPTLQFSEALLENLPEYYKSYIDDYIPVTSLQQILQERKKPNKKQTETSKKLFKDYKEE